MDKPITVAAEEFTTQLSELIQQSGLPAFCIVEIFKDLISELQPIVRQQYERDLEAYNSRVKNNSNKRELTREEVDELIAKGEIDPVALGLKKADGDEEEE